MLTAGEEQQLLQLAVVYTAKLTARSDRPIERNRVDPEHFFDIGYQFEWIPSEPVHLVDEGEDRNPAHSTHLEQLAGLGLDALAGVDQHHRAVGREQGSIGVLAEILVAGRVEDVHPMTRVLEVHHGAADGDPALLLEFEPVAGRVARSLLGPNGAGLAQRASKEQKFLG